MENTAQTTPDSTGNPANCTQNAPDYLALIATLGEALRTLTLHARTTGGVAGLDAGLMAACDKAEEALSLASIGNALYACDCGSTCKDDGQMCRYTVDRCTEQDILLSIEVALQDGHDAKDLLDENSPLRDGIRIVLERKGAMPLNDLRDCNICGFRVDVSTPAKKPEPFAMGGRNKP